eukprot:CAMPEP_0171593344 /NCGR_PEP_ID=MMETSP0990-20121206/53_1 /TAXON_ID=483369 /ORGANISM="non described non described, Strain CCMP2098" /LENGTH=108 /DNA_ID=CAMNT_0012153855 /DNA_START=38 /DNA_END=364 /DNA_ORIENTATION=+
MNFSVFVFSLLFVGGSAYSPWWQAPRATTFKVSNSRREVLFGLAGGLSLTAAPTLAFAKGTQEERPVKVDSKPKSKFEEKRAARDAAKNAADPYTLDSATMKMIEKTR